MMPLAPSKVLIGI